MSSDAEKEMYLEVKYEINPYWCADSHKEVLKFVRHLGGIFTPVTKYTLRFKLLDKAWIGLWKKGFFYCWKRHVKNLFCKKETP